MSKDRSKDRDARSRDERDIKRGLDFYERIIHDEEFGEENVEQVDSDWADFEKVLR